MIFASNAVRLQAEKNKRGNRMKDLKNVELFYKELEVEINYDYNLVADKFRNHNVFANPPEFQSCVLPYIGEVELTLIAIQQDHLPFSEKIAEDDGKYSYRSRVLFAAKPTPILIKEGFKPGFQGLIEFYSIHFNLHGHPMQFYEEGKWPIF